MAATQTINKPISGLNRTMRILYSVFAWLFALCLLIQVFLAGLSIFVSASLISLHVSFVHLFEFVPLLLLIFSLLARFPRVIPWLSLLLIVQIASQYALIQIPVPYLAAFHPVNAVIMFWVTLYVARRSMTANKIS